MSSSTIPTPSPSPPPPQPQPAVERRLVRVVRKIESLYHRGYDEVTFAEDSRGGGGGADGDGDGDTGVGVGIDIKGGDKAETRPQVSSYPPARARSDLL